MEVWSHNLQTCAPMAVGRLGSCLQWNINEGWQIFGKKTKSSVDWTFHLHKNSKNCYHQTRFLG